MIGVEKRPALKAKGHGAIIALFGSPGIRSIVRRISPAIGAVWIGAFLLPDHGLLVVGKRTKSIVLPYKINGTGKKLFVARGIGIQHPGFLIARSAGKQRPQRI